MADEEYTPKAITPQGSYREYRGISVKTMEKYGVTTTDTEQVYTYPSGGRKIRKFPKEFYAQGMKGSSELFGQNLFGAGGRVLTITEGELDAMSAYQMINAGTSYNNPVVSLPSASPSSKLWDATKDYINSFEKIVLSIDNDEPGNKVAERISQMFPGKVYRVNHGQYKDANDFLQAGKEKEFKNLWWKAERIKPDTILCTAEDFIALYNDTPEHEYFPTGIPELDEKILGIHKGYFTVIKAPTGVGKSFAPDTPILMYDGRVLRADEINVGDKLMGPDSKPRKVLDVNIQTGPMYRVTPVKGNPFECNADHILSLRHTTTGEVKNVNLLDYLEWTSGQKHLWKLWRTGVSFPNPAYVTNAFAYAVGAYLGDGCKHNPRICLGKKKQPVIDYLFGSGVIVPMTVRFDKGCYHIPFSKKSELWTYLESKGCLEERHIPMDIKTSDIVTRQFVLAGLLDTDGSLSSGGAEITQKSERLADDICFVARSLGLAAYKKTKTVNGCDYYRVNLSGDMTDLPCQRLKFTKRRQIKNVLNTGFKVEPIGEGTYRGIAVDKDQLFLLGDFTVAHNSEFMRYLENQVLTKTKYRLATCHLEESKLRGMLGLVSYDLGTNLTRKDLVESLGMQEDFAKSVSKITESEQFYQFSIRTDDTYLDVVDRIKYLVAAMEVDFVFLEPIQDVVNIGNTSEKESQLSDFASILSRLASELNVGIVTIAHTNEDGEIKYCKMIGQKAGFEIILERDMENEDPDQSNRTYIKVGRKNRVGGGSGPAGAVDFDLNSYTLTPVINKIETTDSNGVDF